MTNIERTNILRDTLKPLYKQLLEKVSKSDEDKATFCMQWGEHFPFESNTGIMFVGRATNGWVTMSEDVDVLFGDTKEAIFNRHDQLKWVENLSGNTNGYNTNNSAFWRVIKGVTKQLSPIPWYSQIAWSNVCKIAPWEGGNPSGFLYDAQLNDCKKILESELTVLSPKLVIMFTGEGWASPFLRYLNGGQEPQIIYEEKWSRYKCKVYQINGITFLRSEHPQGKAEYEHIQCLVNLAKKFL